MSESPFVLDVQKIKNNRKIKELQKLFKERADRRISVKPLALISFQTNNEGKIINFYDDILKFIINNDNVSSIILYKTIIESLNLYCNTSWLKKKKKFSGYFYKKWLNDTEIIKEFLDVKSVSCYKKSLFYQIVIMLNLKFSTMDFNLFNLKNLIRLFHLIYYNTEDDNAFIFLNTYVCDEFAHLIPQNIGKLFNELKVENVPIDMKRYVNVDRGFLERNGKIRNEKIYNKKVEIRNKLNELLILCDEETASKYSAKLLIKCVEGTTKRKLSGSKVTHNVKEDKLPEYFNDITYTPPSCIVDKTQNLIRTSKILVPGTPESILKKREFRKRKIFFNISEKRF